MDTSNINDFINTLKLTVLADQSKKRKSSPDSDTSSKKQNTTSSPEPTPSFGYVEASKLEYGARVLQKQIKLIIDDAPDLQELNSMIANDQLDMNTKLNLEQNSLLHLASKLKTKYNQGKLKIFDQILNDEVKISSKHVQDPVKAIKESLAEASIKIEEKEEKEDLNGFPELPPIKNPLLYARVFIHKSTINNRSYLNQSELINSHNERLEFLGDSVLNNLVTLIIYNRYPEASEGDMSKIRSLLINNVVLTEFSLKYGFDKKLKSNINEQFLRQGKQKIFADIFEAYIGALSIEHGMDFRVIKDWLARIMEPKLKTFDLELKLVEQINKDAKSELYSLIGTAASHPQYVITKTGDGSEKPYVIQCIMESDLIGEGEAPGLKEAGLRAAMQALKNKPLLEKYIQRRLNTDRSQSVIKTIHQAPIGSELMYTEHELEPLQKFEDLFPLVAKDDEDELQSDAKNELYALLGHEIGVTPTYVTTLGDDKIYKAELKVNDRVIAIAYDKSKKKATTKAAMVFLYNKSAVSQLTRIFKKPSL